MTAVIFKYTREQAIADGVLVDVSEMAKEAGIRHPVALTSSVWFGFVDVPDEVRGEQDEEGRLWDILTMFALAARKEGGQWLSFQVLVKNRAGTGPEPVTLKAHCGPGDDPEPVITIMLPNED